MSVQVIKGDSLSVLRTLPESSVHCCVTSPPYWGLRDFGMAGQLGLEKTPEEYVANLVEVFREVRRVLQDDGTLWLNEGDCYAHTEPGGGCVFSNGRTDGRRSNSRDNSRGREKRSTLCVGLKPKDMIGIPWMLAFGLRADGWYLRSEIIWHKPNPMPESVTDRPTKSHEQIFLLAKSERYYYNAEAIKEAASPNTHARYSVANGPFIPDSRTPYFPRPAGVNPKCAEPGQGIKQNSSFSSAVKDVLDYRNKRSVWTVPPNPFPEAHFATFPEKLIEPCILAGCPPGGTVLDPFGGSGTTGLVARRMGSNAILIELNEEYCEMSKRRLSQEMIEFQESAESMGENPTTREVPFYADLKDLETSGG
jgi:DNA modification methylase